MPPETIDQAIDVQAKGEPKLDLKHALRSGRTKRQPRNITDMRTPRFREPMLMISQRPAGIGDVPYPGIGKVT